MKYVSALLSAMNKKRASGLLSLILLLSSFAFTAPDAMAAGTPTIYKLSDAVKPGEIFNVFGDGLTGTLKLQLVEANRIVTPVQTDSNGRYARFMLPADVSAGAYTVKVSSDDGISWSSPLYLNKAAPQWLSDTAAYPGMNLMLMGRNLKSSEYGGSASAQIRLVPTAGGSATSVTISSSTPYADKFAVPFGLATGNYYVEVNTGSAGIGTNWVRLSENGSDVVLPVSFAPTDATALGMGVSWAKDFNWSSIYNVKTGYGAYGDNSHDDTAAIQSAIDAASAGGGGVVYFPNGTYRFTGLQMGKGVVLNGQSNTGAILKYYQTTTPGSEVGVIVSKGAGMTDGLQGIANLKFIVDSGLSASANFRLVTMGQSFLSTWPPKMSDLTAQKLFFYRNVVDIPYSSNTWKGLYYFAQGPVLIADNTLSINNPIYSPFIKQRATLRDNTIDYGQGQVSVSSEGNLIVGNTLTGHVVSGQTNSLHGFFSETSVGYNITKQYYGNNTIQNMNNHSGNDGEAISFDVPGYLAGGSVVSGGSSSATVSAQYANAFYSSGDLNQEWQMLVIDGKGAGQLRKVTGLTDLGGSPKQYAVTVDQAWDVVPDSTSKYALSRTQAGVVENNTMTNDDGPAVQLYFNPYDMVVADNTATNTQGITNYGIYNNTVGFYGQMMPSFFNAIKRNNVSGQSGRFNNTFIGDRAEDTITTTSAPYAPSHYGNEYKDNVVNRSANSSGSDSDSRYAAGISLNQIISGVTGAGAMLAELLQGNTIQSSSYGIGISPSVSNTLIRNTTFSSIGTANLLNNGSGTQVATGPSGSTPSTPSGLSATGGSGQVALSWSAASGAESYNVKRSSSSGGTYTTIASVYGATGYNDKDVSSATTYYYKVSAVNGSLESGNSSNASGTTTGGGGGGGTDTSYVTGASLDPTIRNNSGLAVGMQLTVGGSPITITQLGRYYVSGNTGTHALSVYEASDNSLVATANVDMNAGTADANGFKYVSLSTPVTLSASTSYYFVSQESNGGDQWHDLYSTVSGTSVATINNAVYQTGPSTFVAAGSTGNGYGPLNFKYQTASSDTSLVTGVGSFDTLRNNSGLSVGMKITVGGSNIAVTQIGRYFVSGNTGTHTLYIYKVSDNSLVASANVDNSTGTADAGGFKYATLSTPVTLTAGTSYYVLSGETNGGDQWHDLYSTITSTSAASIDCAVYQTAPTTFNTVGSTGNGYVILNLNYH